MIIHWEIGWEPRYDFTRGLTKTIDWYLANSEWLNRVTSGDYLGYYEEQYVAR